MQETLTQARLRRGVYFLARLDAEVERPEEFGDADEEVAFGQVDS